MEIVFLLVGIAIGAVVVFLFLKSNSAKEIQTANAEKISAEQKFLSAEQQLNQLRGEIKSERDKVVELNGLFSQQQNENKNLSTKLVEQKADLENLQQKFTTEFKNIANEILEDKSKRFTEQNKNNLDEILKPFSEKIKDFSKKVDDAYEKEMREKISLKEEMKNLIQLNVKLSEDANNLTKALKGDTKKQGNWGELILEKVLERSGLRKDIEYKTQLVTKNVEGDVIKPDVVVFLPDKKHLVVDSKVSLVAYEQFANAETDDAREQFLKEHINSVRSHVKLLSDKNYYTSEEFSSPDFVLLFMPIESAFSAAMQKDSELFNLAWDKHIVIVSPTTLLATLRTVESLWKIESQNRYAIEIANQAGALYDKFEGFVKDLIDIGKRMDSSKDAYEEAMKKISSGTGNLVKRVENLRTLGAKATKQLPQTLLDRANEE